MQLYAILLIIISSLILGIISIFRKEYQIINGTTLSVTLFFILVISVIGFLFGIILNKGITLDLTSVIFAFIYSIITVVTTAICIYATAFGNISTLLLWAMLGSLVLPSLFGVITQPSENSLTVYKIIGLLLALICMAINFSADKNTAKSNKKFKLLCAVVFFTNGSALIVFNLKNRFCANITNMDFIAQYMLFSAIITALYLLLKAFLGNSVFPTLKSTLNKKSIILMISYSILFFVSEILALKCTGLIPLIIQAPITFSVPIITTALIDYAIYKVKLQKYNYVQMLFAFLSCISFILE